MKTYVLKDAVPLDSEVRSFVVDKITEYVLAQKADNPYIDGTFIVQILGIGVVESDEGQNDQSGYPVG